MRVSAKSDYALRALIEMASRADGRAVSAEELGRLQEIPHGFLQAILADLRRAGVVRAQRGAEGGYTLSQAPRDVTIGQILRAVDGPLAGVRGLRPEETRYEGAAENLPNLWVAVRAAVREVVDEVSLAELISGRMPAHVRKLTTRPDAWQPR